MKSFIWCCSIFGSSFPLLLCISLLFLLFLAVTWWEQRCPLKPGIVRVRTPVVILGFRLTGWTQGALSNPKFQAYFFDLPQLKQLSSSRRKRRRKGNEVRAQEFRNSIFSGRDIKRHSAAFRKGYMCKIKGSIKKGLLRGKLHISNNR